MNFSTISIFAFAMAFLMAFVVVKLWFKSLNVKFWARIMRGFINGSMYRFEKRKLFLGGGYMEEVELIACEIIRQLTDSVGQVEEDIRIHALKNKAILYRCTVVLNVNAANPRLYMAIDAVKNLFFGTYDTQFDPELPHTKNHFETEVTKLDTALEEGWSGITITMSATTPYTPMNYDYKKYCQ